MNEATLEEKLDLLNTLIKSANRDYASTADRDTQFEIVIYLTAEPNKTRRIALSFSKLLITTGCLMVVDPVNVDPCEVHCYSMSTVERFIFDNKALEAGAVIFK